MLNSINGKVIICKFVNNTENGINPAITDKINQPILPIGFFNQIFILKIPASLWVLLRERLFPTLGLEVQGVAVGVEPILPRIEEDNHGGTRSFTEEFSLIFL